MANNPKRISILSTLPRTGRNEIHFLMTCNKYEGSCLTTYIPNFNILDDISKFTFLMSQENKLITKLLVTQVYKWVKTREAFIP